MKRLTVSADASTGRLTAAKNQARTMVAGEPAGTDDINELVSLFDFEPAAQRCMSHMAWEYFNSGVADEITLRWNREAYDRLRLRPRVLVDVSRIDTRVSLFGQQLPFPILLAPTADQRMVHPDGELATARGAGRANAVFVVSSFTNTPVEDVARAATAPLWFQFYVQRDRAFTLDVAQRVEAAGCKALCVTVDSPTFGARNRQERARYELAPGLHRPHLPTPTKATGNADLGRGALQVFPDWVEPALTWRDIIWLSSNCKVPVLLKGILNPDDADHAVQEGVAGIIVSNHGGRNLDTLPATADALPHVVERVAGRIPVLVDGGIRRGTDVVKALALGASAVLIGRPYLYGLAVAGMEGVTRIIEILRNELEMSMGLLGRPTIQSIDRSVLWN
jgi:4-hydroxymandelate oxidase